MVLSTFTFQFFGGIGLPWVIYRRIAAYGTARKWKLARDQRKEIVHRDLASFVDQ